MESKSDFEIYQTSDGLTKIDVRLEDETVWLSLDQMAMLFDRDKSTVSRHIKNVFLRRRIGQEISCCKFCNNCY